MDNQRKSTSELRPREWGTSPGRRQLSLGVGLAPEPARAELPSTYDIPLLELLIVDPYYVFVSWEIPPAQLERAAAELGDAGYEARQLELRLLAGDNGDTLARLQLYGETGRWFVRHSLTGRIISAQLGFDAGGRYYELNRAGPVELPRDFIIEPEHYDELHVRYGNGSDGALLLEGFSRKSGTSWPAVSLPAPSIAELIELEDQTASGGVLPGSPGAGFSGSKPPGGSLKRSPDGDGEEDNEDAT